MADDNKIQFDVELNETSVEASFKSVDERAVKSAKSSAAVFGEYFQKQEQDLQDSIKRIVASSKEAATKSARESASVFEQAFKAQEATLREAQRKQAEESKKMFKEALEGLSGSGQLKKSAQESAEVFRDAFQKGLIDGDAFEFSLLEQLNNIKNSGAIKGLADVAGGFFLVKQAADAAIAAGRLLIDTIVRGEKEIKLDKRFEVLAEQAGVAADVLRNELTVAARGFIDETALLNLASESFIQIGNNAKSLPQILEIARKAYAVFGGDVVDITKTINDAIFTGQTRQLRQIGLLIDTERVYKNYARAIGTISPLLTEQQKQTALLNAVIEQGNSRFRNVVADGGKADDALKRLSVSFTQLTDEASIFAAKIGGGILGKIADAAAYMADELTRAFAYANASPLDQAKMKLAEYREELARAQKRLESYGEVQSFLFGDSVRERIVQLKGQVSLYEKEVAKAAQAQANLAQAQGARGLATDTGPDITQSDEYIRRKQDLVLKVQELNNQLQASEVAVAQEQFNRLKNSANLEELYYQQKLQAADQYNQQKAQLEKFYADNGIADQTIREQGREALEQAHLNRMLQMQIAYEEQKKQVFYEGETQALSAADLFNQALAGMEESARETSVNASKNFKNLGRQMFLSVGQAAGNAFAAFGQAIAEGENALEAFGKSLLNSLGQMAIQMGTQFILQGIAYTYAGLANGPPLIAAGAALAAFGGILAASGGAGPRDVSGGGGTAGEGIGSTADNNAINQITNPEDLQPTAPKTELNLTINGNVLDRRETGLEIAKILEEQFSDQGLVIRGA